MLKIALLLFVYALLASETLKLPRDDGSELMIYCDQPASNSFPILLLIPGSQKETSQRLHEAVKKELLAQGFCPITLEKRGMEEGQIDETAFQLYLPLHERLKDHLLFYKNLKTLLPGWNGKMAILGQGDGGRLGAHFATFVDRIEGIALIASGGGWAPLDEILHSFRSSMADDGYSPQYIHGFLVQAKQEFDLAVKAPKVDKQAFGYSYKYWESLLKTHLGKDLSALKCPIYSINGALDESVPINSVNMLAKHLEDRMILIEKKGGREILQDQTVYKEALSWLFENF